MEAFIKGRQIQRCNHIKSGIFSKREENKSVCFAIMSNYIHLIWQAQAEFQPKDIQLSFMKYTAQMIVKDLRNNHPELLETFKVKASDRKYQIWERNPLSVSLWSRPVFKQKVEYIHSNPVAAGICQFPDEYKYSSASFYLKADTKGFFITHYNA